MVFAVCKLAAVSLRILLGTECKGKTCRTAKSDVLCSEIRIILTEEDIIETRSVVVRIIAVRVRVVSYCNVP